MSSRQNPFIEPISSVCHVLNCLTPMKNILYLLSHVPKRHVQISLVTKYRQGLWKNIFPAQSLFCVPNEHYFPSKFFLTLKGWTFKPIILLVFRELISFLTCILRRMFPYRILFIVGWVRSKAPGFPQTRETLTCQAVIV